MSEEDKEIKELTFLAGKISRESRNLVIASARAALFGEQTIKKQYGLSPEDYQTQALGSQSGAGA